MSKVSAENKGYSYSITFVFESNNLIQIKTDPILHVPFHPRFVGIYREKIKRKPLDKWYYSVLKKSDKDRPASVDSTFFFK